MAKEAWRHIDGESSPYLEGCLGPARGQDSGHATGNERFQGLSLTPDHIKGSVECKVQALQGYPACPLRYVSSGTRLHPSLRLLRRWGRIGKLGQHHS